MPSPRVATTSSDPRLAPSPPGGLSRSVTDSPPKPTSSSPRLVNEFVQRNGNSSDPTLVNSFSVAYKWRTTLPLSSNVSAPPAPTMLQAPYQSLSPTNLPVKHTVDSRSRAATDPSSRYAFESIRRHTLPVQHHSSYPMSAPVSPARAGLEGIMENTQLLDTTPSYKGGPTRCREMFTAMGDRQVAEQEPNTSFKPEHAASAPQSPSSGNPAFSSSPTPASLFSVLSTSQRSTSVIDCSSSSLVPANSVAEARTGVEFGRGVTSVEEAQVRSSAEDAATTCHNSSASNSVTQCRAASQEGSASDTFPTGNILPPLTTYIEEWTLSNYLNAAREIKEAKAKTVQNSTPPVEQEKRPKKRWRLPLARGQCICSKPERDVILYYPKAPSSFTLLLVMSVKNVLFPSEPTTRGPSADTPLTGPPLTDDKSRTLISFVESLFPNSTPIKTATQATAYMGPSLLMYHPPINVIPTFNAAQLRGSQQNVPPFEYVIGRSIQTLDQVPLAARRWFSRRHCVIQVHPAKFGRTGEVFFMLKDLRSANGTFLNGRAVRAGCAVPLHSGDLIGVSMTDGGAFMLGFRFMVNAVAERVWVGGNGSSFGPAAANVEY